jgi:hypothetical protein
VHHDFAHALDFTSTVPSPSDKAKNLKKVLSGKILELFDMDTVDGQGFVELLRFWSDEVPKMKNPQTIKSVEEYFHFKQFDVGARYDMSLIDFIRESK